MNDDRLTLVYDKTNGRCHICHNKLQFSKYGANTAGGWEIEHSIPKAKGGTDHLNNLYPAHISCNREKRTKTSRSARSQYGNSRAPYSREKVQSIRAQNTAKGALVGGILGAFLGPEGAIIGASIGAAIGNGTSPDK